MWEKNMKTRLGMLFTFCCHLLTIVLFGGCVSFSLPTVNAIPASNKLPIDGIWKPVSQSAVPDLYVLKEEMIFKIDSGRTYIYSGRITHGSLNVEFSAQSGTVIMKDIQPTHDSRKYTAACASLPNLSKVKTIPHLFTPCELAIQEDAIIITQVLLDATKSAFPGLNQPLKKETLDNEAWFVAASRGQTAPLSPSAQTSAPPPGPRLSPSTRPPGTPSSPAPPPSRRALVIGNAAYADIPLANPVHDAQDLATLLRRLGFDVLLHQNADKPTMEQAVDLFTRGVPRGSAGLFFFSGHGVQIDGVNYLVPIGARLEAASDVKYYAVAADWVLARMDESGMDVKLLFLDACRNNPLGRSWTRALSRGLAVMETPQGALIAYATSPGKTASDGTGRNSPFTAQLLRELGTPGRDIEVTLKAVRAGVQETTQGQQIPWVASSMTGNFLLAR